jgi:polyhydroxyalkanoate synthesis regulator phasin
MKTAALLSCLVLTAGIFSSCEKRELSIPEKITAIYSGLNELDQDIKRVGSKTEALEKRLGDLENKMQGLEINTNTPSVAYLEGRVAALEKRMHDLERQPHR